MHINKYNILTFALAATFLASCSISSKTEKAMEREEENMQDLQAKAEIPTETIPDDVIRVKDDIWLGNTSDVEYEGEPVPGYLEGPEGITLISNRPITLYEIGDTINKITSLRVRYDQDIEQQAQSEAAENAPSLDAIGADWTEPTKMIVSYQGPLSGLLDEVASRFGIWWKYEKQEIYFYKHITKTFVLYSLPTNSSLSASVGGSSSESGGAGSNSISLSSSTQVEMWSNIETAIHSMISSDAQLTMDSSNGTISLTATPNDIKKVSKFINEQNARLSRQVAISVKVLQFTTNNSDIFGLNWSALMKKGLLDDGSFKKTWDIKSLPIAANTGAGGVSMSIISGSWTYGAMINALSTMGKTNLITSGTVTTLNNKPAPIQVVKKQNYISETTKTSSGSDNYYDISVDTDEVETGFTLNVLPRILEHGRLLVMFNMTLSDLIALEKVYTEEKEDGSSGGTYVQNPVVESRGFSQEIAMKSGETLVLSGYERAESTLDKQGVGSPNNILLGGENNSSQNKTMIIILLTPVVLETPLNPETRIN